jgi:hypothetical protein
MFRVLPGTTWRKLFVGGSLPYQVFQKTDTIEKLGSQFFPVLLKSVSIALKVKILITFSLNTLFFKQLFFIIYIFFI